MNEETKVALPITDVKEVLKLAFTIGKIGIEAKKNDGKIDSADLVLLTKIIPDVGPAFDNIDQFIPQLKNMDAIQARELMVFAAAELGAMSDAELAEKIEAGLEVGLALIHLYAVLKK